MKGMIFSKILRKSDLENWNESNERITDTMTTEQHNYSVKQMKPDPAEIN